MSTFFNSRFPGISLSGQVIQILLSVAQLLHITDSILCLLLISGAQISLRQNPCTILTDKLSCLTGWLRVPQEFALPDWGITVRGTRHSLNPGPWNFKEQM
jgi:hypothetical protein